MFVFGSITLWILLSIEFIFLLIFIFKDEDYGLLTFITAIVSGIMIYSNVDVFMKILKDNPMMCLLVLSSYFIIGIIWSTFKYSLLVADWKKDFQRNKKNHLKTLEGYPEEKMNKLYKNWLKTIDLPSASNNKEKICAWITYWPISIIVFLLSDFLMRISKRIYNLLGNLFDKIRDLILGKEFIDEFNEPTKIDKEENN